MLARLLILLAVLLCLTGCEDRLAASQLLKPKNAELEELRTELYQLEEDIKELPKLQQQVADLRKKRDQLHKQVAALRGKKP